ncbi:hypothetical protein NE237_004881 [Protea cynaroides]|uniref:Transmembrane protein n=1 Tax=Protea cynaroides TaxID=273540 RepID=A0A9Q0KJL0_9MAGN|nr:hypothetical protein NE237_004881 [Protea cynaroides]
MVVLVIMDRDSVWVLILLARLGGPTFLRMWGDVPTKVWLVLSQGCGPHRTVGLCINVAVRILVTGFLSRRSSCDMVLGYFSYMNWWLSVGLLWKLGEVYNLLRNIIKLFMGYELVRVTVDRGVFTLIEFITMFFPFIEKIVALRLVKKGLWL